MDYSEIKSIDQKDIKKLLKERLAEPEKYLDKALIIWRSNIDDGIQMRILEEACREYNQDKPLDQKKWFAISPWKDLAITFRRDNIVTEDDGVCKLGLAVIDPVGAALEFKTNPDSLKQFIAVLNNPSSLGESAVPVVAYMAYHNDWFETPDLYPNSEQYVFTPDFEEWAEWAEGPGKFPRQIIDFIKGDGEKDGIIYRWYNFFNVDPSVLSGRPGCNFPKHWNRIRKELNLELKSNELKSIEDLTQEQLNEIVKLNSGISDDVKNDFCAFLKSK